MIYGLRNDWETWAQMEARNRREYQQAVNYAMRVARPQTCLVTLEEQCMAAFAAAIEELLDASAAALGGDRDDLQNCIRSGKVHWRETTYRRMTVRAYGQERPVAPSPPV